MVFVMAFRRMNLEITAHEFGSSFQNWSAEQTSFPKEGCEMALAHIIDKGVEAAYRRHNLFEKRCELMQAWGEYAGANDG
jgi:hypothetical protein